MKNIVLIGARGTGKTAIGRKLAEITEKKFIDLDTEIENTTGIKIPVIFEKQGEKKFRELEQKVVLATASEKNTVIASGGGTILDNKNLSELK
ncbi:hypothetical protein KKB11_00175, partial [Candidatus Micrarchaeota archaeon]|nr:hypothetical protein [Candidatus Micrarchaeota archaeon]